jgi:hypothetical protein
MEGYVYILVNISLPNLVKIGRTTKEPNIALVAVAIVHS